MFRTENFKNREVINIDTAERLGVVSDVEIDAAEGRIKSVIVRRAGARGFFGGELVVPWSSVRVAGKDVILVKILEISPL